MTNREKKNKHLKPPVVVILGHVDHGKTTLLDYIRKTKVAEKESGGITQHIGAYEIEHHGKKMTFLDTPGHEAFSKIRSRGASVADIAVLVIAADEGVKPQTKESLAYIQGAHIPFLVVLTKTDKPHVNLDKIKQKVVEQGVFLEGLGGDIPYVEISAKTGKNLGELLDMLQLLSEMHPKEIQESAPAEGVIIETHRDSRKGNIVSAIVQNGILRRDSVVATGSAKGRIKRIEDERGSVLESARASMPVLLFGFENLPRVGEIFRETSENDVEGTQKELQKTEKEFTQQKSRSGSLKNTVRLFMKADAVGSLEALEHILQAIPGIEITSAALGDLTDGDVKMAQATQSLIVLFRVKIPRQISNLILDAKTPVISSDVIYEIKDKIETYLASGAAVNAAKENMLQVLKVFSRNASKTTLGGRVESGKIRKGEEIIVLRGEEKIGKGKVLNLQIQKTDASEASEGVECGLQIAIRQEVKEGDILKAVR